MAKHKNDKVAVAQVAPSEVVDKGDMPAPDREPRDMKEFLGLSAEIAQDTVYVRNCRWPGGAEDFPHVPLMRTCNKFFAGADGGPLYIDEPVTAREADACRVKQRAMHKRGLRHVFIYRGAKGLDPSVEDVLSQLKGMGAERGVA
jgi:hypothetical protein